MIPTPTASLNPHANVAQEPNPFGPTIGYGPRNKGDLNPNQKHIYITYRVPYKNVRMSDTSMLGDGADLLAE